MAMNVPACLPICMYINVCSNWIDAISLRRNALNWTLNCSLTRKSVDDDLVSDVASENSTQMKVEIFMVATQNRLVRSTVSKEEEEVMHKWQLFCCCAVCQSTDNKNSESVFLFNCWQLSSSTAV